MTQKRIDNKHSIVVDRNGFPSLVKRLNNGDFQPIPETEPVILFRGRDKLAVPMLVHYRELCRSNGCTDYQLKSMDDMIQQFKDFTSNSSMKLPGSTRGE